MKGPVKAKVKKAKTKALTPEQVEALLRKARFHRRALGECLLRMREGQAWLAVGLPKWRPFVEKRLAWVGSPSCVYRLVAAAKVARNLGVQIGEYPESVLRVLAGLRNAGKEKRALAKARAIAEDKGRKRPTAKIVERAIAELGFKPPKKQPGSGHKPVSPKIRKLADNDCKRVDGAEELRALIRELQRRLKEDFS